MEARRARGPASVVLDHQPRPRAACPELKSSAHLRALDRVPACRRHERPYRCRATSSSGLRSGRWNHSSGRRASESPARQIAERGHDLHLLIRLESERLGQTVRVRDSVRTGDDPRVPRGQHHVRGRPPGVEGDRTLAADYNCDHQRGCRAGWEPRRRSAQPGRPTRGPLARGTASAGGSWRFRRCRRHRGSGSLCLPELPLGVLPLVALARHREGGVHARSLALRRANETRPQLRCISCPPVCGAQRTEGRHSEGSSPPSRDDRWAGSPPARQRS